MRARIPRPPLAVESSHCLTLNIMRPLSRSAAASSVLGVFRMLCISNFGVRNWPLVLVPGVNPFGRPELRCSGQCGDLNPLNPTRSTQCPTQNPSRRAFPRSSPRCSSRPCASSLISALRLLAHLGLAPSRSSRPCASSAHLFDSSMVHGDVAPYFAAAAPSLLAPLARPAPPPPLAVAYPLVQHLTRRLLATRPTPRSRRLIPGDARRTYCWC